MSDMLLANPDDDIFWPPIERTEAQGCDVTNRSDAWIYSFLGSRVQSFSPSPDRVVVYFQPAPPVDTWALGAEAGVLYGPIYAWTSLPRGWEPRFVPVIVGPVSIAFTGSTRLGEANNPPAVANREFAIVADLTAAITDIKKYLGITDADIEAATGVSRSTLWRTRSGRTSGTRSVTDAPLWRLHSLATGIVRVLGPEGARGWLRSGDPTPADLLRQGRIADVELMADQLLFPDPARRNYAAVSEDDYSTTTPSITDADRPAPRPPRRAIRAGRAKP